MNRAINDHERGCPDCQRVIAVQPKAPVVDLFEEVRRWVASIGSTNLDTGQRITKADALLVIDRILADFR